MSKTRIRVCASVDEIVEALGGRERAMTVLDLKSNSALSNWKERGIPASRFLTITNLLKDVGARPSPELFFGGAAVL